MPASTIAATNATLATTTKVFTPRTLSSPNKHRPSLGPSSLVMRRQCDHRRHDHAAIRSSVRRLINTGLIAHPPYGYDDKIFFITSPTANSADGSTRSSTAGGLSGHKTLCSKWRHAGGAGGFG